MKKKLVILSGIMMMVVTISVELRSLTSRGATGTADTGAAASSLADAVAGEGTVEPISEDIELGSEMSGKVKLVNVKQGDMIHKSETLAVLENDDFAAELASAIAGMRAKEAALHKVIDGALGPERSEALASERAAQAVMNNAQANLERRQELFDAGVISCEELQRFLKEYTVAKEQYQENAEHYSLINRSGREEDIAIAQAELALAKASVNDSQAKYEKTIIRSPIDGTVLRIYHRAGESISSSANAADPILTVGDTSVLRVRVDIDETDVNKVRMGQKAYVTADAFGRQRFCGHVVRIGELLGPKTVTSDQPRERVDREFLEVLVELDPGAHLPIGLRVDSFLMPKGPEAAELHGPAC
jgi:HlyD family secretion protein